MTSVVYWNNIPSPYLVERLNTLALRDNLHIEAWFNARTAADRSWDVDESQWQFPHQYLPCVGIGPKRLRLPVGVLRATPPRLLVSLYAEPSFVIGSSVARWRGIRTAYWVEPTFDTWTPRRPWRETFKRQLFARVDAILTTGKDGVAFAKRYGARPESIHTLPYFADYDRFSSARDQGNRRLKLRRELGISGTAFLYVGRLWWGKGVDYLLDAFCELRKQNFDVTLVIAGDGEEEAKLREKCQTQNIGNVLFIGFARRELLPSYYAVADVFVFPTLGDPYGQVVGEAMSCGLPIISSDAAGEIHSRVENDINGYIVPAGNSFALFDRMNRLANDPALRRRMGEASAKLAAGMTQDAWADRFEEAVARITAPSR